MATYDAVTMDEAKVALGLEGTSEDENLARLITGITLELERRLRTQFIQRAVTEYHEGGSKRIYLQRTPIVSVTSITDPAANTVAATDYVIRQQRWLEHYGCFDHAFTTSGQKTDWIIVYNAGWFASTAAVTKDVKTEVLRAIGSMREAPAAGVQSVTVGDLSISYGSNTGGTTTFESTPSVDAAVAALHAYAGVLL